FHANPIRGSRAVLSNWMPTRPSVGMQIVQPAIPGLFFGTYHWRFETSKFACRFASSVSGVAKAQANPRFTVKLLVTRQLSCTKGRNSFQRRPVVAPRNV